MTYAEAMERIGNDMLRRAGWNPFVAVSLMEDDHGGSGWVPSGGGLVWEGDWIIVLWTLDNSEGIPTGMWGDFDPTEEDLAATDWEVYDARKLFPEDGE